MAVSSAEYAKVIDQGICPTSNGPFASGSPYFVPTGYPEPDPARAKQLVAEARQETGQPVVVTIAHVPDPATAKIAEYLQQQFENAGMQVSLATIQQAQAIGTALAGSFESIVWQQFGAVNPDLNYIFWSPTNAVQSFAGNMARNTDPRMETALLKGRQSPAPADRVAAYQEVGRLMGSDIPYIWTDRTVWSIGAQPKVQNWNNPTTPAGKPAFGMITGSVWPTQIWLNP
jgi:peptide/nickel transport system substrate-binding protein